MFFARVSECIIIPAGMREQMSFCLWIFHRIFYPLKRDKRDKRDKSTGWSVTLCLSCHSCDVEILTGVTRCHPEKMVAREGQSRARCSGHRRRTKATSNTRAALLRRGFILGYRAALRRARKDLDRLAANFDAEIASLQDEARKELHSLTAGFSAEIGAIAREVHREKTNRAVREAASERATIPNGWLH